MNVPSVVLHCGAGPTPLELVSRLPHNIFHEAFGQQPLLGHDFGVSSITVAMSVYPQLEPLNLPLPKFLFPLGIDLGKSCRSVALFGERLCCRCRLVDSCRHGALQVKISATKS